MHILGAIIGFIGMALFWYYRLKDASRAVGEVSNKISSIRGNIRRKSLRNKANLSPITAIDSPLIAASTLMVTIQSEEFVLGDADEEIISNLLLNLASQDQVEEALVYAKWANSQVQDSQAIVVQLGNYLNTQLNDAEKQNFLDLLIQADKSIGGSHNLAQRIDELSIHLETASPSIQ